MMCAAQWLAERLVPDVHSLGTLKGRGDDRQLVASSSLKGPLSDLLRYSGQPYLISPQMFRPTIVWFPEN